MPIHDYYMIQFSILLLLKHFICDFVLQNSDMALAKAIYGSNGSLRHSMHHGMGTFIVSVMFLVPAMAIGLALLDFLIHYHIDWIKMKFGPRSYKDKHYWVWFGADQFLHQLTYILLLILVIVSGQTVDFKL
jgi:hypothetical protein